MEVILFLSADDSAQFSQIVGHQQGHVEVVTRQDGVILAVSRVDEGASLLAPSGQPLPAMPSTELWMGGSWAMEYPCSISAIRKTYARVAAWLQPSRDFIL